MLIVVFIVIPFILALVINPNQFKPQIEKAYHQQTGGILNIEGNIHWRFISGLHLSVGKTVIQSAPNQTAYTITIPHSDLSVAVLPLLSHQLNLNGLNIDGLQVDYNAGTAGTARLHIGTMHLDGQLKLPDSNEDNAAALAQINGHLAFAAQQIQLQGINLKSTVNHVIQQINNSHNAIALISQIQDTFKQIHFDPNSGEMTDLGQFNVRIHIVNGIASFKQLALTGPVIEMQGAGQIHLPHNSLAISMIFSSPLLKALKSKALAGLTLPVNIHGALSQPSYQVNWQPVKQQLGYYFASSLLSQSIGTVTHKTGVSHVTDAIGGLFQGLANAIQKSTAK